MPAAPLRRSQSHSNRAASKVKLIPLVQLSTSGQGTIWHSRSSCIHVCRFGCKLRCRQRDPHWRCWCHCWLDEYKPICRRLAVTSGHCCLWLVFIRIISRPLLNSTVLTGGLRATFVYVSHSLTAAVTHRCTSERTISTVLFSSLASSFSCCRLTREAM